MAVALVAAPLAGLQCPGLLRAGFGPVRAATVCTVDLQAEEVAFAEEVTRNWIGDVIVPLRLCPFAAKPFAEEGAIRYEVLHIQQVSSLSKRSADSG